MDNNLKYTDLRDHGGQPYVVDIEKAAKQNENFRLALWTGEELQATLMSIKVGGAIGAEMHDDVDQFLRIEQGVGLVKFGREKNELNTVSGVKDGDAIFVPAGTWHNVINIGLVPMKLYSIYAPPQHPFGTVTKKPE